MVLIRAVRPEKWPRSGNHEKLGVATKRTAWAVSWGWNSWLGHVPCAHVRRIRAAEWQVMKRYMEFQGFSKVDLFHNYSLKSGFCSRAWLTLLMSKTSHYTRFNHCSCCSHPPSHPLPHPKYCKAQTPHSLPFVPIRDLLFSESLYYKLYLMLNYSVFCTVCFVSCVEVLNSRLLTFCG